jgi:hypothetical protein
MESTTKTWRSPMLAIAWSVSAIACVIAGGYLGYATAGELRGLTRVVPPTPKEVTQDVIVRNVADNQGRRASFRILLFSDEFRWRLNSYDTLDTPTGKPQFTPEMKTVLNDAHEIVCIGASSEEIPAGVSPQSGRQAEEQRAGRRAERISSWVREALSRPVPVRKLNVGHHAPTGKNSDTSDQRRMIIILILEKDADTNIDEALRVAMKRESDRAPIFDSLLTRYSLAGEREFNWIP